MNPEIKKLFVAVSIRPEDFLTPQDKSFISAFGIDWSKLSELQEFMTFWESLTVNEEVSFIREYALSDDYIYPRYF